MTPSLQDSLCILVKSNVKTFSPNFRNTNKKPYLERAKEFYKELSLKAAPEKELMPEKARHIEIDFGP